ncbi:MAG: thiosulfate oxidation carrier protein SoxY [Rhodospirillaceae bacterium]|nr:thiosulfate oxidation carrier protein SoxY [Rhodospirillaceae bacterium]
MSEKHITTAVLGRRQVLKGAGLGALAVVGAGLSAKDAFATPETAAAYLDKMVGSGGSEGKINLKLPEIAENGATVPITVSVDSPMSADSYVKTIHLVAEGNPNPELISFNMSPGLGKAEISTRVRLGKTQFIRAAAVMSDGSVHTGSKEIKVTIGGCGG